MTDRPKSPDGIETSPPQAFSRKSDANAFTLPPKEIHRQLLANIDSAPVPDKDSVGGTIKGVGTQAHARIQEEMDRLGDRLLSGDPDEREKAQISLDNLGRFTFSKESVVPELPEVYPKDGTPEASRLTRAIVKVMRGFGRRDDPRAEIEANRTWNRLRDPGTRDKAITDALGKDDK